MNFAALTKSLPIIAIATLVWYGWQSKTHSDALLPNSATVDLADMKFQTEDGAKGLPEFDVVPNSVHDGDTIRVRSESGQILKIRFACIDAPELKQPLGIESRNYLRSLLNQGGNKVKLRIVDTDRYGRTVAEVWNSHGLVQSQEAIAGMAYAYDQYAKNCPNFAAVKSSEKTAINEKIGVWKNPNLERPWEYRKRNR
ncbi:MAG TPA: thermonuclease family protein [Kamptonema sp.]|nr:thermonuclease family protein [Kamptonema sp.]